MDVALSLIALALLWPLGLLAALAIRLDSPGPVFFRQERVGLRGRTFRIHKFRTMRVHVSGPLVTASGDARITRVGRVLRRYKLDELPQLIDVLRGRMSLVGPRPEVPRYMALYPEAARGRILSVRPGITDPASIAFIDEEGILAAAPDAERAYVDTIMPIKQRHYLDYVEHRSMAGDLRILLCTVGAVFGRRA
ncbi:sugar transferase [Alicycliphilus sp. T452]